ncbi:MAG: hypothetical protein ACRC6R_08060 [Bacteroidales bacterium]
MRARTYQEWSRQGYVPFIGERSRLRNHYGEPLFTASQVVRRQPQVTIRTTTTTTVYR